MNISNKNYRNVQKAIFQSKEEIRTNDALTAQILARLEKQRDGSKRSIADNIGRILGYILFKSKT
ncbi:MAG: hypothetical protein MSA76_10105 [Clostridium sp.]|nr:hypothetical protein [Clostridium sp.]